MKLILIAALALLALTITGKAQPRQETADWYLAHPDETEAARQWCDEHPTERDQAAQSGDRTCIHVYQAATQLILRKVQQQRQ